ncbi:hypothetical protein C9I82_078 [Candidatus Purcelliella pentastirinorum]|uniref:Uncharacterized protein n=1 Tax=Candidatus Purcelliella pentastirinorum TaxID=472834 RepID=A0A346DZA1_9ENTR|nr:hypothetical protein C9I82_078 [Candidatus Purcelliella pentastirinorum]
MFFINYKYFYDITDVVSIILLANLRLLYQANICTKFYFYFYSISFIIIF